MDISLLTNATSPDYMSAVTQKTLLSVDTDESFDSVLSSAINMLNETNDLQNDSQSAKIQFALGEADNPHDMQIAAAKAYEALQYTCLLYTSGEHIFGDDDQAARVGIQPVDAAERADFAFCTVISRDGVCKRIPLVRGRRVYRHACRLVNHQKIFVLVTDREGNLLRKNGGDVYKRQILD